MMIKDPLYSIQIADPEKQVLPKQLPHEDPLEQAFKTMILSASGWRKVFAQDLNEESSSESIGSEDRFLVGAMGLAFSRFLKEKSAKPHPCLLLGMDSRPTGPLMGDILTRVFLEQGVEVIPLFIVAAPEIMAYAGQNKEIDGFCYISASHNPIGHNGVKFGLTEGGVIGGEKARELIDIYRSIVEDRSQLSLLCDLSYDPAVLKTLYNRINQYKTESYKCYLQFIQRIAAGSVDKSLSFTRTIKKKISLKPLGIIGELNGSARSLGADKEYLEALGIQVKMLNNRPRQIVHAIVPEGDSLDLCRRELEKAHIRDACFTLGYVPDCDGDRGNLVYYSEKQQEARILQAQEVFALSALSELCDLKRRTPEAKAAIAVNGPTSMRIDQIAEYLGVSVFRAEVGEANVVTLAEELRDQGYSVPILGEGSNGGNITYPARVRDPLNTLTAIIKLLTLTSDDATTGLFELWCQKSGQQTLYRPDFSLDDILDSLPYYTTTSAFSGKALMKIQTLDHGMLKQKYEEIFLDQWKKKSPYLKEQWGICGWKELNTEGTRELEGMGPAFRSGKERGGLKILLHDKNNQALAYLWMRGSGTEPVFRVMVDSQGSLKNGEAWLLDWHRSMVEMADRN